MKVLRLYPDVKLPICARPGEDNAYDLFMPAEAWLYRNIPKVIPLGIAAAQTGCGFLIVGRSTAFTQDLIVTPSLIDAGYRGEWHVFIRHVGLNASRFIGKGERIAQAVPVPTLTLAVIEEVADVTEFGPSARGAAGLGSSGS